MPPAAAAAAANVMCSNVLNHGNGAGGWEWKIMSCTPGGGNGGNGARGWEWLLVGRASTCDAAISISVGVWKCVKKSCVQVLDYACEMLRSVRKWSVLEIKINY